MGLKGMKRPDLRAEQEWRIKMSIHNMGMSGGCYGALMYTASDGPQRFDREHVSRKTSGDSAFGTVMTEDELQQWIREELSRNQDRKKTLADMTKDSCAGWSTARFKYVGEARTYSYYEFVEEMEKRSAASLSGEKETPISEQQIALLFEDKEPASTDKTARERWEQSFDGIASHAPESVKQAWLDAAETAGMDGMGVSGQGKLSHISQMMVQRCILWQRGENGNDMLGSSVNSAIRAAQRALYDLEHPLEPRRAVSPEKRQNMKKEKTFYLEFIKRLQEAAF